MRTIGSLSLLGLLLTACAASQSEIRYPPISTASAPSLPGKLVWFDLLTDRPDVAQAFYADLLGWSFDDVQGTGYTVANSVGTPVAGIAEVELDGPAVWLPVISVTDVDAAARRVVDAGGGVAAGPLDLTGRGRVAQVVDPQGAGLVLLRSASGDPPDNGRDMAGFTWAELWSPAPDAAADFYRDLTGASVQAAPEPAPDAYRLLVSDGVARAGLAPTPVNAEEAFWIPFLLVGNLAEALARVEALGGEVVAEPIESIAEGQVAVVADPTGAVFAVEDIQ